MLRIEISSEDRWDEENECFLGPIHETLYLEHSLVSISKWESKFHKSYIATNDKTLEESLYYIECMITSPKVIDPNILYALSDDNLKSISDYINDPMTATTINRQSTSGGKKEIITSELLYYYMAAFNIPVEFQKWHLNRLMTLIQVCNVKQEQQNGGSTKTNSGDILSRNAALNEARRKANNSKG